MSRFASSRGSRRDRGRPRIGRRAASVASVIAPGSTGNNGRSRKHRAAISALVSRACQSRPMSARCCAPRNAFGAAYCFIVGPGLDARASGLADTSDTAGHVPLWRFPDIGRCLPQHCALVGVELLETPPTPSFRHPVTPPTCWARSVWPVACACCSVAATWCEFPPVRAQSRGGGCAGALRPTCCSAAVSPNVRLAAGAPAQPATQSRVGMEIRGSVATFLTGWPRGGGGKRQALVGPEGGAVSVALMRPCPSCLRYFFPFPPARQAQRPAARQSRPRRPPAPRSWASSTTGSPPRTGVWPDRLLRLCPREEIDADVAGSRRGLLTVTERPAGRDAVAISAGFDYPQGCAR